MIDSVKKWVSQVRKNSTCVVLELYRRSPVCYRKLFKLTLQNRFLLTPILMILLKDDNIEIRSFNSNAITIKPTPINCPFMATRFHHEISSIRPIWTCYHPGHDRISSYTLAKTIEFDWNCNYQWFQVRYKNICNQVHPPMMNKGKKIYNVKNSIKSFKYINIIDCKQFQSK